MPSRDFDAWRREQRREPIEFDMCGEHWVVEEVPFAVVADAASFTTHAEIRDYLSSLLGAEQGPRFVEALRRERVDIQDIRELSGWIVEQATGRPTLPRSSSPGSRSADGPPSKPVSLVRESRRAG